MLSFRAVRLLEARGWLSFPRGFPTSEIECRTGHHFFQLPFETDSVDTLWLSSLKSPQRIYPM